ncbi:phage tail spike protein [Agrococcus casei]|uniref:phage tail spike protein n=1 Tax=Agrococcus casei TaxID=343512 RepID=UPI003F9287D2
MATITGWGDRLSWSGETPLDYPDLNPVAFTRMDGAGAASWADDVNPGRSWELHTENPAANFAGDTGAFARFLRVNNAAPATDQSRVTLPYFPGLWPGPSGRLLFGAWSQQAYVMSFSPILSTRGTPDHAPLAYLSTDAAGTPRQQVYSAAGALVLDQYEVTPWRGDTQAWVWHGQLVDLAAGTSQLVSVRRGTADPFIGPVRTLSGAPNGAATANLDVMALQGSGYWSTGNIDEVMVAHPGEGFDLALFADRLALGGFADARASQEARTRLTVTDLAVHATDPQAFSTGAERVSWSTPPEPGSESVTPHWSTDNGATWSTGALPAVFSGLLRWQVALAAGEQFTGMTLLPAMPTLAPLSDVELEQNDQTTIPLDATWSGEPAWAVAAPGLSATVSGTTLSLASGWAAGELPVTVTLRDQWGRSVSRSFTATVQPQAWTPPPPPQYPRAPIVVWGDDGPEAAIIDALSAVVTEELNGEHTTELSIPRNHRHAAAFQSERLVELAGDRYRIRRVTDGRDGRTPVTTVYCEAEFYDLAYAGQLPPREYLQVPAGAAMEDALQGTGWSIAAVTVTTRRTYSVEELNPLSMLRTIQSQHGGDLIFNSADKTVSLVTQSGRNVGVSFAYGRGLTESKRVVDTTSLVTRIYARNEEGVTIASVNNGLPYVEDFTWTSEVREATYDFASGTSPFTMLSMVSATLANRSKPSFSYEFTVADLSHRSRQEVDRFDVGDVVTVVDDELGIRETQRIVRVEHDVIRPWQSRVTLSAKLRELGSSTGTEAGALTTGSSNTAFDLVPFNLLRNARFDNGLAHWASSGVERVDGDGTGDYAVRFQGTGTRWIEQTVQPDNRDVYSLSLQVDPVAGGTVPPLRAIVTVEYEDGTRDAIPVDLV